MIFAYFFLGSAKESNNISWGVNFSQKHASSLGLDFKEVYLDILDDLGVKQIKLGTYWDYIEYEKGKYDFSDLDFLIEEAEKREAKIILVIGMKTIGWPECHIPTWAKDLSKEKQQESILQYLTSIVERYKGKEVISYWQVENEPFFTFGECPWKDRNFLKQEIDLVHSLDPTRKIIITESGEIPFWFQAAKHGDIVGVTTYRKVWSKELNIHITYPLPAVFYNRKAKLINFFFNKPVIGVELQAEPWSKELIYNSTLEEQEKSMNLDQFKKNIAYAKKTGFDQFYLWGAEWWYWLKDEHNRGEIWNEAKNLFEEQNK